MFSENDIAKLQGATAYCEDGNKIGSVGEVYLDDNSGQPEWVTVNTGLFGTKTSFAPLDGASLEGDRLNLGYGKDVVTDAPKIDEDGHLSPQEEQELYRYYQRDYGTDVRSGDDRLGDRDRDRTRDADVAGAAGTAGLADTAARDRDADRDRTRDADVAGHDRDRGRTTDDAEVTLSEERLNVGTEEREAGHVRLRKHVTTEEEQVTVPVQKEKLVVEREPVEGRSTGRIDDSAHQDETITLREERPVVDKETVDVEKVRVGKETVTEQETVSGTVRKEHADIEGDADANVAGRSGKGDRVEDADRAVAGHDRDATDAATGDRFRGEGDVLRDRNADPNR